MRFSRFWRRSKTDPKTTAPAGDAIDPLLAAGQLLRERREQRGLSLRDLSREIRITTPVLEALERGWRDRIPEPAYLGSMLVRLEQYLELSPGSLSGALPPTQHSRLSSHDRGARRFTVGSIDIVSTWQGSVVYVVVIIGSLLALNQQQRYLAHRNSQALEPIPLSSEDLRVTSPAAAADPALKGLRPVDEARQRPLTELLPQAKTNESTNEVDPSSSTGLLELRLSRPSSIRLSSAGGDRSALTGAQGNLTLQLLAPLSLTIQPPPAEGDQVLWNGVNVAVQTGQPGRYRLPQTAPRSP